jgi:hypothetical protein
MKATILTTAALLASLGALTAHAGERYGRYAYGEGLYVGVGAGQLIYKEDGLDTMRPTIIEARLGQQINPYFAIEGRVGGGISRDDVNGASTSAQFLFGAYAKGILPLSPMFSAYGIAGVAGTQLHHNYPDFNTTDTGFSYGIGGELKVGGGTSLTLEWARVNDGNNAGYYYTADHVVFGVNWRF